jgi:hypothetical protein
MECSQTASGILTQLTNAEDLRSKFQIGKLFLRPRGSCTFGIYLLCREPFKLETCDSPSPEFNRSPSAPSTF